MKNILRLVILFVLVAYSQCAFAKDVKFIQISDSHVSLTNNEAGVVNVQKAAQVLLKTIDDINTVKDVDFVIFTGDNIDSANADNLKAFLKAANKLKYPYFMVIGNHEVFKSQHFTKKDYMKIVNKYSNNCRSKNENYVFEKNGFVFIVVDGAKEVIPGPAGYFREATLKWFDKELTKHENDNVIVFQHFPIVEPYFNRTHGTYNKQNYISVMQKHKNIIGIFSGHYHANGEQMQDNIYHASCPALVVPPHNYKIIEISGNSKSGFNVYTQLRKAE